MEFSQLSAHTCPDFTFAFNNANFSDRTLRLEIMPDSLNNPTDGVADEDLTRNGKRRCPDQQNNVNEAVKSNGNPSSTNCPPSQVKTIYISTVVLAAKSHFFYKASLMAGTVKPLTDAAKGFLVARFKKMSEFEEEMLTLPLVGIEAVLSRDDLEVDTEDCVYDFVMMWARKNYKNLDKRREILKTRLQRLIRFPFMSCDMLQKVLTCREINHEVASKLVFQALSFKIRNQQLPWIPRERAYIQRPVKVIRFDSPEKKCKVYLDLKREDCARLLPSYGSYSENFDFGGQEFYLFWKRDVDKQSSVHSFGLFLQMRTEGRLGLECEFSRREKSSKKFVGELSFDHDFTEAIGGGFNDLFGVPWDTFLAEDSPYFINGVLHLKATLRIKTRQYDF